MILVDTHIHAHPCFDIGNFLDAARIRMNAEIASADPLDRVLCLTEAHGQRFFRTMLAQREQTVAGTWRVRESPEPVSIRIENEAGHSLWFVAGRQIVASERLELLCLGHDADLPDRVHSLCELTERILAEGGLPVLPWGFGKWTGGRGRAVKNHLEREAVSGAFCLGDNGNRPSLWPEPAAFGIARARNIPVLPGSDPLPLASACEDAGRYGLRMDGRLPPESPWAHLRARLVRPDTSCAPYGRRESLLRFFWNQTRLRLGSSV